MEAPLLQAPPAITVTNAPSRYDLQYWWQVRQSDPDTALGFADDAPQSFEELLDRIDSGEYLFYLAHCADEVVGGLWMHDIIRDPDGTPRVGWIGAYVLSGHRGRHTTHVMWTLTHNTFVELGVRSIYWASHHKNTPSHTVAERHIGLYRVGIYRGFTLFGGEPTDCVIYATYEKDIESAWEWAKQRAEQQLV